MIGEFRQFLLRGNVVEIGVGVVMGWRSRASSTASSPT